MNYYLLVYDRHKGSLLVDPAAYSSDRRGEAVDERFRLERMYRLDPNVEVVLLGAESRADLERTHARYFKTFQEIASA